MAAWSNSHGPLPVGVVSRNYLAAAHLREILERDNRVQPLCLADLMGRSPRYRSRAVIVVDNGDLGVPLSWCLRNALEACRGARLLVLDGELFEQEMVRLMVLGARGFLAHAQAQALLLRAVRHVAKGGFWVTPSTLGAFLTLAGSSLRREGPGSTELTEREMEVFEMVKLRYSNREIAETLRIQTSTVKFHMSNILSKLGQPSRRLLAARPTNFAWETLSLP